MIEYRINEWADGTFTVEHKADNYFSTWHPLKAGSSFPGMPGPIERFDSRDEANGYAAEDKAERARYATRNTLVKTTKADV
jgi:hypothetical protein